MRDRLTPQQIAALGLLMTIESHVRSCQDGPTCTRAPSLMKRLDVYTRYAFTTRDRKKILRFALEGLADAHPRGAAHGRAIMSKAMEIANRLRPN